MDRVLSLTVADVIYELAVGICVWELTEPGNPASLVLRICNPAAARFLSVEIDAVLHRPIAEGFPGSLATPMPGVFTRVIETGQAVELGDVPYSDEIVPDGMFSIRVFPTAQRCALVEFTNVTEARRAASEVAGMLAAAKAAQSQVEGHAASIRALDDKLALIETQKREIQDLTAPILALRAGVLVLPLVGRFDRQRSEVVRDKLLTAVAAQHGRRVVIDVTGLEAVDATIAGELLRLSQALALLGAESYFSGISPAMALAMVTLDQGLPADRCVRNLEQALRLADD